MPVGQDKSVHLIFIAVVCATFILLGAAGHCAVRSDITADPAYPVFRELQYAFTLQNKTNRMIREAQFWAYGPVTRTSTQRCLNLTASYPHRLIVDDLGNQVLHFRVRDLGPHAAKTIVVKASLGLSEEPNVAGVDDISILLKPERFIESEEPEIMQLAVELSTGTIRETAEKTFRWVAGAIHYAGYLRDTRGALYALRNKRGDCTEYMCLFVALCRANAIAARGIGGYVMKENTIVEPASYHNWAEFFEDGAWRVADPQKKVFTERASQYVAMRIIGPSASNRMGEAHRFRVDGDDIEVAMTM